MVDADGVALAPLLGLRMEGARPVYLMLLGGLVYEVNGRGDPLHSSGVFYDAADCSGSPFVPSAGNVSDVDDLATLVLDWYSPGASAVIRRAGDEAQHEMAAYAVAYPDGSRACLAVSQGPTTGVPVRLERAPRWRGPVALRAR